MNHNNKKTGSVLTVNEALKLVHTHKDLSYLEIVSGMSWFHIFKTHHTSDCPIHWSCQQFELAMHFETHAIAGPDTAWNRQVSKNISVTKVPFVIPDIVFKDSSCKYAKFVNWILLPKQQYTQTTNNDINSRSNIVVGYLPNEI